MDGFCGKAPNLPAKRVRGRTKFASILVQQTQNASRFGSPGPIFTWTDFTVTPAIDRKDNEAATAVSVGDSTDEFNINLEYRNTSRMERVSVQCAQVRSHSL